MTDVHKNMHGFHKHCAEGKKSDTHTQICVIPLTGNKKTDVCSNRK